MKKVLLLLSVAALIAASCGGNDSRRDATSVGEAGWVFEGWACAPDTAAAKRGESPADYCKDTSKFDHLYMKFSAVASEKAIKSNRVAAMQSTCRQAAKDQIAGDGLSKVIGDHLEKASGVSDGQSTGQVIVSQTAGKIKGIGVYDCCAIDNDTGSCIKKGEPENWEQCQCVGFMKFPGGQKAFESMAQEASR
ncbi:lipoprotein LipL21 [Leptospira sp. GIMC2001]|uniref:lipoprotein LipL21 n=1 Tax=Leptospira sp. GIMC2001 TaxID=1513297 RepID=UPI002349EFAC|nr:lipoprotein LipL21 [Leptospira sp. GIMC2001]WCL49528.1 lipoprotein LipL21 [Leptospira sp. GIMC2001]